MEYARTDIMGMPIRLTLPHEDAVNADRVFTFLTHVDEVFSTYKNTSEISQINRGLLSQEQASDEVKQVFTLAEKTKHETNGYFDIRKPDGTADPSGVVKGWAIHTSAQLLLDAGCTDFMINIAGDIATSGKNPEGGEWSVGIRNPFDASEIVKVLYPHSLGVATSGSYERDTHIYNPHSPHDVLDEIVSITVIADNVLVADLYATASFAMGRKGIEFLENIHGVEGYSIDRTGIATMTTGFSVYTQP